MKTILAQATTGMYPVPVSLVTSKNNEGVENIITLAWNGIIASKPPTISISVRSSRFTHPILTETRVFGMNVPTRALLEKVDYIGTHSGRDVDKFKETGLTRFAASIIDVPLIQECPVNLECRIIEIFDQGTHTVFFAEIVAEHVTSDCLIDGKTVDYKKADPLTYCSSQGYFSLGEYLGGYGFSLKRSRE